MKHALSWGKACFVRGSQEVFLDGVCCCVWICCVLSRVLLMGKTGWRILKNFVKLTDSLLKSQGWSQKFNEWQRSLLAVADKVQERIENSLKWILYIIVLKFFSHPYCMGIFTGHFFFHWPCQLPYFSGPCPLLKIDYGEFWAYKKESYNESHEPTIQLQSFWWEFLVGEVWRKRSRRGNSSRKEQPLGGKVGKNYTYSKTC